ncbi:hypothetical protein [Haloarchaeobius salinus]|uniref:hypothetical protein n=1 Tax=Haloarchaeobius salinus TaxID=1198298 RepID=UPI00210F2255|nr:hypothetical protein [Haloarchaeobius salinus]
MFQLSWGGGAGLGDPIDRDPERVREDVANGYISHEMDRSTYGVAVDGEGIDAEVDAEATEARREEIRSECFTAVKREEGE